MAARRIIKEPFEPTFDPDPFAEAVASVRPDAPSPLAPPLPAAPPDYEARARAAGEFLQKILSGAIRLGPEVHAEAARIWREYYTA